MDRKCTDRHDSDDELQGASARELVYEEMSSERVVPVARSSTSFPGAPFPEQILEMAYLYMPSCAWKEMCRA